MSASSITRRRLGKLSPRRDGRTLRLARYLRAELPPPPDVVDYGAVVTAPWGMMQNDVIGDCTCAAAGHLIMLWTTGAHRPFMPTDDQIVAAYSAVSGYDPATGNSDNGAVELDVLNYWRKAGIAGHKIGAYVAVDSANADHIRQATYLFEGSYIGLALPASAQGQIGTLWDVPSGGSASGDGLPGSWGGHAVPIIGYDATGPVYLTWGQPQQATWAFHAAYCEEAYAIVSQDMIDDRGQDLAGVDLAMLTADLRVVAA